MQFQYSWIADPLYFGDYPKIMRESQVTPRPAEFLHTDYITLDGPA